MPELKEFAVVGADPQGMHAQLPNVGALVGALDGELVGAAVLAPHFIWYLISSFEQQVSTRTTD